jgi:hypothetical protein
MLTDWLLLVLDGLAKALSPALPLAVPGADRVCSSRLPISAGAPQKNNNPVN